MKKAAAPTTRWFTTRRLRPAAAVDPADLGTAFGLDLSLMPDEAPPAAPAAPAPRGWRALWTSRRRGG